MLTKHAFIYINIVKKNAIYSSDGKAEFCVFIFFFQHWKKIFSRNFWWIEGSKEQN